MSQSYEAAIVTLIEADSTVGAIMGDRIYPNLLPDEPEFPAVVYQEISTDSQEAIDGPADFAFSRLQLSCWAETKAEAVALAQAICTLLQGYKGDVTVGDDTVTIRGILLEDRGDLFEPAPAVNERRRYGKRVDFMVSYSEP